VRWTLFDARGMGVLLFCRSLYEERSLFMRPSSALCT
jgi:hypothetical protein